MIKRNTLTYNKKSTFSKEIMAIFNAKVGFQGHNSCLLYYIVCLAVFIVTLDALPSEPNTEILAESSSLQDKAPKTSGLPHTPIMVSSLQDEEVSQDLFVDQSDQVYASYDNGKWRVGIIYNN